MPFLRNVLFHRGVLNTPDAQMLLGLITGIWASLGFRFATFQIISLFEAFFMGNFYVIL